MKKKLNKFIPIILFLLTVASLGIMLFVRIGGAGEKLLDTDSSIGGMIAANYNSSVIAFAIFLVLFLTWICVRLARKHAIKIKKEKEQQAALEAAAKEDAARQEPMRQAAMQQAAMQMEQPESVAEPVQTKSMAEQMQPETQSTPQPAPRYNFDPETGERLVPPDEEVPVAAKSQMADEEPAEPETMAAEVNAGPAAPAMEPEDGNAINAESSMTAEEPAISSSDYVPSERFRNRKRRRNKEDQI